MRPIRFVGVDLHPGRGPICVASRNVAAMELRVAAYAVVVDEEGRWLLAHLTDPFPDQWTLPGGGVDPGEHPEDAAVRETFEETGLHIELDGLLGVDSLVVLGAEHRPGAPDRHSVRIVYRGHVVGGELRHEVGGSTDRAAWHPADRLGSLPVVGLVRTVQEMVRAGRSAPLAPGRRGPRRPA